MQKVLIFTSNQVNMKLIKLSALPLLFCCILASSCEKEYNENGTEYVKNDLPVTGAQVSPQASPSSGTGKLTASYSKRTKLLTYSLTWSGLSDSVMAIRISGPAPVGYGAFRAGYAPAAATADTTTPYNVLQQVTGTLLTSANTSQFVSTKKLPATGSYTGTILIDGVKFKEVDLMNGLYFITIHSKTILPGTAPANLFYRWYGEIRAQLKVN
jgi:hypothetical protein